MNLENLERALHAAEMVTQDLRLAHRDACHAEANVAEYALRDLLTRASALSAAVRDLTKAFEADAKKGA